MCGNSKPFEKRLSPSAETPNHSGNDFRHARKCQTIRETTFAVRGNAKLFGKRLSPCAETPNHSGNDFCHARKHQTFCGMICGRPARYINKKSNLKKCIFKVLCKRRRLPTLPYCPIWHGVPSGELRKKINKKSVHLIAQMNALIKRRRLPALPHCIAVPSAQVGLTSLFGMGRGGTPPQ